MSIYGILIGIAVVLGIELFRRRNTKINALEITYILLSALIGARLLFDLHNIPEILSGDVNPIAIWDGGLAIQGAVVAILLSIFLITRRRKLSFLETTDSISISLPLMQAIGRIGNYFNHELYGSPTNLPWAIYIPPERRLAGFESFSYFHPTFLYESILNTLLFVFLIYRSKKSNSKGQVTALYLIGYALIRLLMNRIRIDGEYFIGIETSDMLSGIFISMGLSILLSQFTIKSRTDFARFVSRPVTILIIALATIAVILKTNVSLEYSLPIAFLTFFVPLLAIYLFKQLGITSDYNVTKREERPKLFLALSLCILSSLYVSILSTNMELITIYTVITFTFILGVIITFYWKISFHMIWSILSCFVIIYLFNNPYFSLLLLILPFIGWSRLELKRHTISQVIGGTVLSTISILLVLTLLKF